METELWGVSLQPEGQAMLPVPKKPVINLEARPTISKEKALKLAEKKAGYLRKHSPGDEKLSSD